MASEKYMFMAAVVIAIAFFGFMLLGSGSAAQSFASNSGLQGISSHEIDESAKATVEPGAQPPSSGSAQQAQEVALFAGPNGYDKTEIRVKAGVPVHFTFTANGAGCCAQLLIDRVGVQLISRNGQTVDATFTPPSPGKYPYHCGMNMCRGVLVAE
jgi:plastocyanin